VGHFLGPKRHFYPIKTHVNKVYECTKVLLEILHTHLGFIFPKVFLMIIIHYSISYSLGRIFL
jgi:hypothetical protein